MAIPAQLYNMDASYTLSDQQTIILTMVAQGYTRKEIADALFISVGTVRTHRDRIRANLNVTCTESAVLIAIQLGILSVDEIEVQLKDPTLPIPDHLK